jgi:hypothetical protein
MPQPAWGSGGGGGKKWWLIGGVVAAVVVAAVAVPLALIGGKSSSAHGKSGQSPSAPSAGRSPTSAFPVFPGKASPVTGRVTDAKAGLSWSRLGKPWVLDSKVAVDIDKGMKSITSTFKSQGKKVSWAAVVASGVVGPDAKFHYGGPATLEGAALGYVNNVLPKDYVSDSSPALESSHRVTVSGRPGWLMQLAIRYHVPGLDATEDTDVVVVVDTGRSVPSVFVLAIPNDANNLLPDITAELNSLRVGS